MMLLCFYDLIHVAFGKEGLDSYPCYFECSSAPVASSSMFILPWFLCYGQGQPGVRVILDCFMRKVGRNDSLFSCVQV